MTHINADLHTHTFYSHGTGSPEDNVRAAVERGLQSFAVSEHGPAHVFYGVRGKRLEAFKADMRALKAKYADACDVKLGLECNLIASGKCDLPADWQDYDVRILGFHKGVWPKDANTARAFFESLGIGRADPVKLADALLCTAETYHIGIISHPSLYAAVDLDTLAKGAGELGVLLEINNSHPIWNAEQLKRASGLGARFIIGSDAHKPENVGRVDRALALAQEAGLTAKEIVNLAE